MTDELMTFKPAKICFKSRSQNKGTKYLGRVISSLLLTKGQLKYLHTNNGQLLSCSEKTQRTISRMRGGLTLFSAIARHGK
jgi:hypothetical protein